MLIGIFGAIGEPAHDLTQLLDLLGRPQFIVWMVGTLLIVAVTMVVARFLNYFAAKVHEKHEFSKEQERLKLDPAISHEERQRTPSGSLRKRPTLPLNVPIPNKIRSSRLRMLRGLAYALISGILSAHSLLVAKTAVELVIRSLTPPRSNQFNRYQAWLALIALLAFALSQLYYLHQGLRLCSTSVLYPFVFCMYNIIAIIDGLVYFNQSSQLTPLHVGLIALGTVVLLGGVVSLSWRLDEISPSGPAIGPVTTDPEAPLEVTANGAPDHAASPAATSPSESTPLLSRRRRRSTQTSGRSRRPTLSLLPPHLAEIPHAPSPTAGQIWAELDDSDAEDGDPGADYLASLPRPPAHFPLHQPPPKRRRRGLSVDSKGTNQSRVSFADPIEQDQTEGEATPNSSQKKRVVSAPYPLGNTANGTSASISSEAITDTPKGRVSAMERDAATHITGGKLPSMEAEHSQSLQRPHSSGESPAPSRWDASRSPHRAPNLDNDTQEEGDKSWAAAPKRWASWFYKPNDTDDG